MSTIFEEYRQLTESENHDLHNASVSAHTASKHSMDRMGTSYSHDVAHQAHVHAAKLHHAASNNAVLPKAKAYHKTVADNHLKMAEFHKNHKQHDA